MIKLLTLILLLLPMCVFGQDSTANYYFNKGMELLNAQKPDEAIPFFKKGDALEKAQFAKTDDNYRRSEYWLIRCHLNLAYNFANQNNKAKAIKYQKLAVKGCKNYFGKEHPDYEILKYDLKAYHTIDHQETVGDEYYEQGINLYRTQQSHLAVDYLKKSDSLEKALLTKKHLYYNRSEKQLIVCWSDLANFFFSNGQPDWALANQTNAANSAKRVYGKKHPIYLTAQKTLDKMQLFISGKAGADAYYNRGMELKNDHPYDALSYFQKADTLEKATLDPSSPNYNRSALAMAECNNRLAGFWFRAKSYASAIEYKTKAAEIYKKVLGEEDDQYINTLRELAGYYYQTNNFEEQASILTIIAEIIKKKYGEGDKYFSELESINFSYGIMNKYDEQVKYQKLILEFTKKKYGEESRIYIKRLSGLAWTYEIIHDYAEAIRLHNIAVELSKKAYGTESEEYLKKLSRLSESYSIAGNDTMAIKCGTEAMEIGKKIFGEGSSEYASTVKSLAYCYGYAAYQGREGYINEAIRLQRMAMEIFKKNAVEDEKKDTQGFRLRSELGKSLDLLAAYYAISGNYKEAVECQRLAIEHEKEYQGNLPYTDDLWISLARYQAAARQYDKGAELYHKIYDIRLSNLSNELSGLSSDERTTKWSNNYLYDFFFSEELPYAAYKCATTKDTTLARLAYNGIVLSKGFLLNSEFEILNVIEQKGNSVLKERCYKMNRDRAMLDSLMQISADKRSIDADSLSKAIKHEEHDLAAAAWQLGDYIGNLAIDWTEIQKKLKDGDMAVEFAKFRDIWEWKTFYAAFVIKKGMKSPVCVPLFEIDDFNAVRTSDYYKTPKLYNLIWEPLAKHLQGVKSVYFSPSGRLHTIAIESLPDADGKIFSEKYDAYRLSSTRELALNRTANTNKKAATYGGIQYEFSENDWRSVVFEKYDNDTIIDIPVINDKYRGSGMAYLDGTQVESTAVANLLRSVDYNVDALSDAAATEESFKRLSGMGLKILHIGTHGFYQSEADMENAGLKFFTDAKQQTQEDRSLSCSGLLFAGANSALDPRRNKEIPLGADDGVLTAKEISRLDFRGLDLVVLSACQTGLGEITGEGVFGLQRGFKKAGAQTIVMSLWKVSDESTQTLMIEFFKNLTAGQSKRAAFTAAQKTVRAKYPNPLHWAAFVMVDGI